MAGAVSIAEVDAHRGHGEGGCDPHVGGYVLHHLIAGRHGREEHGGEAPLEETVSVAAEGIAFDTVPAVATPKGDAAPLAIRDDIRDTVPFPVREDIRDAILRAAS